MDKEKASKDFISSLKISFKTASVYNTEHPALKSSVENLKNKIDILFNYLSPIKISFTSHSLLLGKTSWEKEKMYVELAKLLHLRKIKSIEIIPGITLEELISLISKIHLPSKDILQQGGIRNILKHEKVSHIKVEEFDYYQLLKGEGEEIKDIWVYLLSDALEKEDSQKLMDVTDSFEKVIHKFAPEDIIENKDLYENFSSLFSHLKIHDEKKFRECGKSLAKSLIMKKTISPELKLDKLSTLISDLKEEDMASVLTEEIIKDDKFDSLSFNIFSKLANKEKHKKIASSLKKTIKENASLHSNQKLLEKIGGIFSGTSTPLISEIYRKTLASFLKDITSEKKFTFDHVLVQKNFRFILINLLERETDKIQSVSLLKKIFNEKDAITNEKDFEYLKFIFEVLKQKKEQLSSEPIFSKIISFITDYIEDSILEGEVSLYFEYFIEELGKSNSDVNIYLKKIFTENKVTIYILQSFFKFFPEYLFYFNINLEQKTSDIRFLEKMIECLKMIDSPKSFVILKNIFLLGSHSTKIIVLKAMQKLSEFDEKFLFPILKKKDYTLKGEVLVIFIKNENIKKTALEKMFFIRSPFGIKNRILIEHIKIVEEKEIMVARDYLLPLSKRKFFWNRKLKEQAIKVLKKWNDRKS